MGQDDKQDESAQEVPQEVHKKGGAAEHLKQYRFKPGKDWKGNAGGRPKGSGTITGHYTRLLKTVCPDDDDGRTWGEVIAEQILKRAKKGDVRAASEVADRVEGKAKQRVEIEEVDSNETALDLTGHTDEELDKLDELLSKATPIDDIGETESDSEGSS